MWVRIPLATKNSYGSKAHSVRTLWAFVLPTAPNVQILLAAAPIILLSTTSCQVNFSKATPIRQLWGLDPKSGVFKDNPRFVALYGKFVRFLCSFVRFLCDWHKLVLAARNWCSLG